MKLQLKTMISNKIKRKKFGWGGVVLISPLDSGGMVSIVGSTAGGSMRAPNGELAKIHSQMLLEGTKKHSKKEIQIILDSIGANLQFGFDDERLIFSGRVRRAHAKILLELIAEILFEPSFPKPELNVLKKREAAGLALAEQDPHVQSGIGLARMLFAKSHPNYEETTQEQRIALKKITQNSLVNFHRKCVGRNSFVISLAGDVKVSDASKTAIHFKTLPARKAISIKFKKAAATKPKRFLKHIPHKSSIDYLLGLSTGITSENKDFAALLLGIQVLGNRNGFTGRLMKTVREEEGLTYGVYATLNGFAKKVDGYIGVWATFAPQLFDKGKAAIMREIKKIVDEGVGDEEARKHCAQYEARSRTQLSNSMAFARAAHALEVEGRKLSYLDEFPRRVLKLTPLEINRALKKYLKPDMLSEAAAGPVK